MEDFDPLTFLVSAFVMVPVVVPVTVLPENLLVVPMAATVVSVIGPKLDGIGRFRVHARWLWYSLAWMVVAFNTSVAATTKGAPPSGLPSIFAGVYNNDVVWSVVAALIASAGCGVAAAVFGPPVSYVSRPEMDTLT
ncbi:hypothetical protein [Serinicoccus marinus]|uniref:hypothetical protein n=1 Tax=Serinicoccus marinus TaxID=247333 RepID=UPI0024930401|nr:hypothetical protein [Serinicoccus marinus]